MTVFDWFLIFVTGTALEPVCRRGLLSLARRRVARDIARRRSTRVVTLIHREEVMGLLGFPFFRYGGMSDWEEVVRAIRLAPKAMAIDLVVHTPRGLDIDALPIARALKEHTGRTRVIVPHQAMSGGTLIALAADEILMDSAAILGPIDPHVGGHPASSILKAVAKKDPNEVGDEMLILADVAGRAMMRVRDGVAELLADKMPPETVEEFAERLTTGDWTQDHAITAGEAREMGLIVRAEVPAEFYRLLDLYSRHLRFSEIFQTALSSQKSEGSGS